MKIAIMEDDVLLHEALAIALKKEGYSTISAFSFSEGRALDLADTDLILMDINLPGGDGISLSRQIRKERKIPILFLTARDEEEDMLEAFEAGADDYVVKPFPMRVLLKRIQVILRRNGEEKTNICRYKRLEVDFEKRTAKIEGRRIDLTAREYQLLEFFARHRGQILSKDQILNQIWDVEGAFVGENTVSVTVNRLRRKLEEGSLPQSDAQKTGCLMGKKAMEAEKDRPAEYIRNIFGMGYQFGE